GYPPCPGRELAVVRVAQLELEAIDQGLRPSGHESGTPVVRLRWLLRFGPWVPRSRRNDRRNPIRGSRRRKPRDPSAIRLAPDGEPLQPFCIGDREHVAREGICGVRSGFVRFVAFSV